MLSAARLGTLPRTIVLCLLAGAAGFAVADDAGLRVITGATIIDGVSDEALADHALVIEGNTISALLAPGEPLPRGADVIELDGRFVIPGLIDSHVHWLDWMGELFINHGVTSVVALDNLPRARREASQAAADVPRLYHSGRRPPFGNDDSAAEIRTVIAEWLGNEPDIAHFPTHNRDSARAYALAAAAVHEHGFMVFGHAENAVDSIADGHDVIEHVWAFTQAAMSARELAAFQAGEHLTWATFMSDDWDALDAMIADAVERGVYLNPTIVYEWGGMSRDAAARELDDYRLLSNPDLVYFPGNIADSLLAKHRQIKNFSRRYGNMPFIRYLPDADRREFEAGFENVREFIRRFVAAGGRIQAGTDTITGGMPGLGLHQEMQMLVEAGLTPMQALKATTRWSAELLEGKDGARGPAAVGSIEPGRRADLVVLAADPLADIFNTQSIVRVMKDGRWIELGYTPEYYTFTEPSRSVAASTFAPVISAITPASVPAGQPATRVVLEGSGFQMTSLVRVDGISVTTHFVSPRRVEFDLPAGLMASPKPDPYRAPGPWQQTGIVGYRSIAVHAFNPPPEGGTSNTVHLMVRPAGMKE
ncbi:MAG: amidohydrolase family protein [Woeseiaceae bacterium]|nr:amidohydrolase family protein [Woeseiaceae bacterium]